jgi:hypothetical protein
MVFLEGGKGGFQELADTSKGGEESGRENCSEKSSGPPYACNNAAHDWSSEILVKKRRALLFFPRWLRWMIILWPCLSFHGWLSCRPARWVAWQNLAIPLVVGGEISV